MSQIDVGVGQRIEGVASAVSVACLQTKLERNLGMKTRLFGTSVAEVSDGHHPMRATRTRCIARSCEQIRSLMCVSDRCVVVARTHVRFAKAQQAFGQQWIPLALLRSLDRASGSFYRLLQSALAHLHQRLAIQRLCAQRRLALCCRELDHRGRIFSGTIEMAQGDAGLCAQVEQIDAFDGFHARCAQRLGATRDGLGMPTGACHLVRAGCGIDDGGHWLAGHTARCVAPPLARWLDRHVFEIPQADRSIGSSPARAWYRFRTRRRV
ncbi:MAG: hypothetical protein ACR2GP_04810 [Burkholderiaceae bacterium]